MNSNFVETQQIGLLKKKNSSYNFRLNRFTRKFVGAKTHPIELLLLGFLQTLDGFNEHGII